MNIADVFIDNNGQLNWDAISTISNITLATILVIITLWNVIQVKKQTGFMKIDRLVIEMDKPVAPLYEGIDKKTFAINCYLLSILGYCIETNCFMA